MSSGKDVSAPPNGLTSDIISRMGYGVRDIRDSGSVDSVGMTGQSVHKAPAGNVLFLTSRLPFPPIGGDRLRTFNFARFLKQRYRLTIASFVQSERERDDLAQYEQFYDKLITVPLSKAKSNLQCLGGLLSRAPLQVHYYASAGMRAAVEAELSANHYDVIISHLLRMAQYLPVGGNARKVIDFTDAISLLHRRCSTYRRGLSLGSLINTVEAYRVAAYEQKAIENSDLSLFVSPIDADYVRNAGNASRIAVIPNGVDCDQFPYQHDNRAQNQIVFVGNMRTFPNTDAVRYFAASILPRIQESIPDVVFTIVGNEPSRRVRDLHDGKRIIVTGRVDSVVPYMHRATVAVVPMRACTGIQNKILEALAVGTPVVTTTLGAEGLKSDALVIADNAEDFARATVAVMRDADRRSQLAAAGRAWIETHCSWDAALSGLHSALELGDGTVR